MTTLTIKLPDEMKARLELEAEQSGTSVSAVIRDSIAERFASAAPGTSLHARTRDLCGAGASGTPDLATDPRHLDELGQ